MIKFEHIIIERLERFPEQFEHFDVTSLARLLDSAIDYGIAMAERNYKLVIPQYRPQRDKIQFLLPLYLGGEFTKSPDLALVLDLEKNIYTPETILPLDAAYQNARVIAKPDALWLDPQEIVENQCDE
ncbi:MAG TPA: DUF3825 domain-containing protein [Oscillospiraceae bacterium]|nr:DUF3825 domain-containing protein [Oscillospiraceae bacterium]